MEEIPPNAPKSRFSLSYLMELHANAFQEHTDIWQNTPANSKLERKLVQEC